MTIQYKVHQKPVSLQRPTQIDSYSIELWLIGPAIRLPAKFKTKLGFSPLTCGMKLKLRQSQKIPHPQKNLRALRFTRNLP
jgi:hypothetical protein